jgi:copper transport protein
MIRILFALSIIVAAAWPAGPAEAHAMLLESTPADGAVLAAAPAEILLRFDEPVRPIRVAVLDSAGQAINGIDRPQARDNTLILSLPKGMAPGGYVVSYRVTSLDSHVVAGAFVFSIGKRSDTDLAGIERSLADRERPWLLLSVADRLLLFLGLIGAAGGVMFHVVVGRDLRHLERKARRGFVGLASLGLAAALLGVGIEGAQLKDVRASRFLELGVWRLGESTSLGLSLSIAGLALILMIIALWHPLSRLTHLALPAALLAVGSLALTGHALTAGPLWLTAPLLILHVLIAAFWLGALWPLGQALARLEPGEAILLVKRFSAIALPAVVLLIAAGAAMAFLQLGRLSELFSTAYGLRLSSKLAFVAVLLMIAALNRLWLTPALAAGRANAVHRLRASVGLEVGFGLAILAATSSLGAVPPPRALLAATAAHSMADNAGFTILAATAGRSATIQVTPAAQGANVISANLMDAEGRPLDAQQVTIEISRPAAGIEAISHAAAKIAPGVFRWEGAMIPLAGEWQLRLKVLVSDFEETRFETSIRIR